MHLAQNSWWTRCLLACTDNNFNAIEITEFRITKQKKDFTSTEAKTVLGTLLIIHLINYVNNSIYAKRIN